MSETSRSKPQTILPDCWQANAIRRLRFLRNVKGWRRLASSLLPTDVSGGFRIENESTWIQGDLGSFLEKEIYLYGGYEELLIEKFLDLTAGTPQRTVLDVGANIGQHSVRFSAAFKRVHSFEPNPKLWEKFERNVSLNPNGDVTLHKCGLANEAAKIPFYNIENKNEGLGTFSDIEQYDQSLELVDTLEVDRGDELLRRHGIDDVDAMKIDVQGLEGEVLLGLQETIQNTRPIVWIELGAATQMDLSSFERVQKFFPYPVRLLHLEHTATLMIRGFTLTETKADELPTGDYFICPLADSSSG